MSKVSFLITSSYNCHLPISLFPSSPLLSYLPSKPLCPFTPFPFPFPFAPLPPAFAACPLTTDPLPIPGKLCWKEGTEPDWVLLWAVGLGWEVPLVWPLDPLEVPLVVPLVVVWEVLFEVPLEVPFVDIFKSLEGLVNQ